MQKNTWDEIDGFIYYVKTFFEEYKKMFNLKL